MPHAIDDDDWPKFKRLMRDYSSGRFRQKPPKNDRPKGGRGGKPFTALLVQDLRHTENAWAARLRPGKRTAYFITLLGDPTGGTFTLRAGGVGGEVTEDIAWDADGPALAAALKAAGHEPYAVHFGSTATYDLGGEETAVTPRRWLVEFSEETDIAISSDEIEGESVVTVTETPLNVPGGEPAFFQVRLDLPHDPAFPPIRAGSVVVYEKSPGGEPVVLSAEPREWPGNEVPDPYDADGDAA